MAPTRTAVSAPGKVLLAGGYLVLDRKYTGLVFGLDARIHTVVHHLPTRSGVSLSEIIVRSPQFKDAEWRYGYRLADDHGGIEVTQLTGSSLAPSSRNIFVETALSYALTYVATLESPNLAPSSITILADNDYYSQTSSSITSNSGQFADLRVPLLEAHKTGLGSSAALVTSFTAAILSHYLSSNAFSIASEDAKTVVHNLAQAAHCAAQGKVGSGFDVAAAVYGSCIYKRFSPSVLEGIGEIGSSGFSQRLKHVIEGTGPGIKWDTEILREAVKVPRGIRLVMCDVDCGSQTVGMVKNVLKWRKDNPVEADALWDTLQQKNTLLGETLSELTQLELASQKEYDAGLQEIARGIPSAEHSPIWSGKYSELRDTLTAIRSLIQDMSSKSSVAIEPKPQTDLLDACSALPGVIGGVVPGAGGYDAIALLVVDTEDVMKKLSEFLVDWKVGTKDESGGGAGKVRMLGVREEMEGVKVETQELYTSWL
ncbi:MAG: phosphomevalonate kinase [Sclerophora amabilis]|nr:MAG: phosphomevalonate kinase [Sclerophora amabilis]